MSDMTIEISALNDQIELIKVEGYLDAHTFEQLDNCMLDLFSKNKVRLVVDLNKVDYISSAGAGVFIGNIGRAQDSGGNIILLNPSENVKEVFELLGLTQIFTLVGTQEEAVAQF
jgi:anti-sigma B factor antagonist